MAEKKFFKVKLFNKIINIKGGVFTGHKANKIMTKIEYIFNIIGSATSCYEC